jgi:tetratricopeptide (TPR) repeat protein
MKKRLILLVFAALTAFVVFAEDQATVYFNRGEAFFRKGDWNRAISEFTKAIRLKPNYVAYFSRGWTLPRKVDTVKRLTLS